MSIFKWAVVGDLQIPYEDQRAVALWFKVMKWWKPNAIDIVGDIDDQLEYSKYSMGTTDEFFHTLKEHEKENARLEAEYAKAAEKAVVSGDSQIPNRPTLYDLNPVPFVKRNAEGAKSFYQRVRKQHPNADIHVSLGNHDIRVFDYIDRKAPEYVQYVTPNELWALDDLGMTYRYYHEKPFERFEGIHVHHGNTTSSTGPTALKEAIDLGVSYVRGHSHKSLVAAKHYFVPDRTLHALETGHMCDPHAYGLQYAANPDWDKGFGLVYVDGGAVQMNFIRISSDYTCIVDGKLFAG